MHGCAAINARYFMPNEGVRQATYKITVDRGIKFRTSDGIYLVSDIYHPKTDEPKPTILVRIPFTATFVNKIKSDSVAYFWASRGYHVVIQGTRGRFKSGGKYYPLRTERSDGIETLHWLAEQPWFDGRLGMWGGSAFGYTQWVIADQDDPGPKALAIQIASTDFHSMFYPGGAFSLESSLYWAARSHGEKDVIPDMTVLKRGYIGFPLIETDDRSIGDVEFFNDWVKHTGRDEYWADIDGENRAKSLKAPVLLMAGWYDPFLPTQLKDFITIRSEAAPRVARESILIIGPWTHAGSVTWPDGTSSGDYRKDVLAPSIPWFDYHLGMENVSQPYPAPFRIYIMGDNIWRDEYEWPLARTQFTDYFLESKGSANSIVGNGALALSAPKQDLFDSFQYDPLNPVQSAGGTMLGPNAGIALQNKVEERNDVLVYTTTSLERDIEVTGPINVVLYVKTTAENTDFTAKLVDVYPDGRAFNISEGIIRRGYLSRNPDISVPTKIHIELWPTSNNFKKDHKIRLEISSSNYPRFDRNLNTGTFIPEEVMPVSATQKIYHGEMWPSKITLPVIPR